MNQNASGPSIMAGLTAGVGSRTADCDMPYIGLTTNGLARHTWSAFSDDVTAQVSADFVEAHCLTILNEPMKHEGGHTTTDLCLPYRPDQGAWMFAACVKTVGDVKYGLYGLDTGALGIAESDLSAYLPNPRFSLVLVKQWESSLDSH
jgi:hypothetical protein